MVHATTLNLWGWSNCAAWQRASSPFFLVSITHPSFRLVTHSLTHPHAPQTVPRPNMKICVLGNAVHCEEAERIGCEHKSVENLKKFNKNKKIIKKFAAKYDAFVASDTLIKQIPRLLGPGLTKV